MAVPGVPFVGLPVLEKLCTIHKMSEARVCEREGLLGKSGFQIFSRFGGQVIHREDYHYDLL